MILVDILGPNIDYETIFLKDTNKVGIFAISDIESISYSSYKREVNFNLTNGEVFSFKRKFQDMEVLTSINPNFYKVERGTIINTDLVRSINFKKEYIYFKSGNKISLSKIKLKKIEEIIFYKSSAFYL